MRLPLLLRPQTASVFVAATMSKAWEPLSVAVAHGGPAYSFPAALVLCEAAKVVLLLPLLAFSGSSEKIGWKESFRLYGLPAVALAVCNLCLGFAVPRLGALLYQVIFQVGTVVCTAALAVAMLGERLEPGQWAALALLCTGSLGAVGARGGGHAAAAAAAVAPSAIGVAAALIGALTLSLNTVLSQRAARGAPSRSVVRQAVDVSAWGVVSTAALLAAIHGGEIARGELTPLAGFGARGPWGVVGAIAAADLTMTIFTMTDGLGANAYSVSRALAMVCTPALAIAALGASVSRGLVVASAAVAAGGYLYARYSPPKDGGAAEVVPLVVQPEQ